MPKSSRLLDGSYLARQATARVGTNLKRGEAQKPPRDAADNGQELDAVTQAIHADAADLILEATDKALAKLPSVRNETSCST